MNDIVVPDTFQIGDKTLAIANCFPLTMADLRAFERGGLIITDEGFKLETVEQNVTFVEILVRKGNPDITAEAILTLEPSEFGKLKDALLMGSYKSTLEEPNEGLDRERPTSTRSSTSRKGGGGARARPSP
jgi:hypothetical protein